MRSLVAWIEADFLGASQAYLNEHQDTLLTDEGESALEKLHQVNPNNQDVELHLNLLRLAREQSVDAAYDAMRQAQQAARIQAALQALMSVRDGEQFIQVLEQHPELKELSVLQTLADTIAAAHEQGQTEAALGPLSLLLPLLDLYNGAHADDIDPDEHRAFVALHEQLLPVAQASGLEVLVDGVKSSFVRALNTLGNHYASQEDHAGAVGQYDHAIEMQPDMAMLYRNRAGQHIALKEFAEAEADMQQAEQLEPDAERLPRLWSDLGNAYAAADQPDKAIAVYNKLLDGNPDQAWLLRNRANERIKQRKFEEARADLERAQELEPDAPYLFMRWSEYHAAQAQGEEALTYAKKLRDCDPDNAEGYFHLAVGSALVGEMSDAIEQIRLFIKDADPKQLRDGVHTLEKLVEDHPQYKEALEELIVVRAIFWTQQ